MKKPLLADKRNCTGCLACIDSCGRNAIFPYISDDGHYYIKVEENKCIGCLRCEKTCPVVSGLRYGESDCAYFYAAWNRNDEERLKSASGGVFSAMAHYVLDQGGWVVGAATENSCDVSHIVITDLSELYKLQGSKYTQSDTCGIYKKTYDMLREGKLVLFSGTGCQIGGLLAYLKNKKYLGKLITVDLICGGVPSKLLLQKFVENEQYEIKKILSYRTKECGWKPKGFRYNMKVEDRNGIIHDYTGKRNLVTTGFSTEMTNRYSCYNCHFMGERRLSNFTIGDLWGDSMHPEEHYKGLSLLIAHNEKAVNLLKQMDDYLALSTCNEKTAKKVNFRLVRSGSINAYTIERRFLAWLFSHCSYKMLKRIYANDYPSYSPFMIWKIVRKIYLTVGNKMAK